ncbi:MAG: PAS domain-containing protein [Bacteroidetes bacterium]|nr:PAS domain-containing protein [Bacteroidota bacterium]
MEFEQIGVDLKRMNKSDLNKIKSILNRKNYIVWINDYTQLSPYFINDFGTQYYGIDNAEIKKKGYKLYEQFMHPDHFNDVHKTISQLTRLPREVFDMTYRVKNRQGEWRWIYSLTQALNFKENGSASLVLSIVFDVGYLLSTNNASGHDVSSLSPENQLLLDCLSDRELDVLKLIAQEKSSKEIGAELNIEASTVNAHKNRMIKKLGVKNSFGLMKYATLFNL